MVAGGSCRKGRIGEGGQNRRDDNICIIFNARTSRLRGGRHSPPPSSPSFTFLFVFYSFSFNPPPYPFSSTSSFSSSSSSSTFLYFILLHPTQPPSSILLNHLPPSLSALHRPSNTTEINTTTLGFYLHTLIVRTQIYCVSLVAGTATPLSPPPEMVRDEVTVPS